MPVPAGGAGTVTVSMPYYRCPAAVRRAVDAVLAQTHTDLRLVVVNDGDRYSPPWPYLETVDDPRLVRVDLRHNRGRYFTDAAVLAATDTPWFAIHDADDWAEPEWLDRLLTAIERNDAVTALAPQWRHDGMGNRPVLEPVRPAFGGPRLRHVGHHATVYRTTAAQEIGGHPGYRIGFDSLWIHLVAMLGPVAVLDQPLYHREARPESLTTAAATGSGSVERRAQARGLQRLYTAALTGGDPGEVIRDDVPVDLVTLVYEAAHQVRASIAATLENRRTPR